MSNAINTASLVTGKVRISYEHLTKPYANQPGAEEKFSATLLIPKTDIATKQRIDAAINAAITEGVGSKWNGVRPPQPPTPVWDGDGVRASGEAFGPECKGCWVVTASSKQRPEVVDVNIQPIIDATQIYSGMYARVSIRFFAYNSNGKKGIGCGLGNVQKLEDGEPLGGRTTASEDFGGRPGIDIYPQQAAPTYPQAAPTYQAPAPAYAPQQQYYQPAAPTYAPPAYQAPAPQIDPITGRPVVGPVMGL